MDSANLPPEITKRRTFAIISHPDAGKTTLTEKLLLFGGAIQLSGMVKARGQQRRSRSDWMKVEQERGISVTASVMTFDYQGHTFNLLDTPGHQDFSEDTYRTLTAVDSAIMVLDVAKGIETQTRKLFEVCRLRDIPIITFINKLDREGQDPFTLLDEIENDLALDVVPASWPIGMGREFLGAYDIFQDRLMLIKRSTEDRPDDGEICQGLDDPKLDELLPPDKAAQLREEVEMVRELCPSFKRQSYLEGHMTPVFFGSALNNFGVRELLGGLAENAPPPQPQKAKERMVSPEEEKVSGFVFKIQANMDPKHRDRLAFLRLCSGKFKRGLKMRHSRTGKMIPIHNPLLFLAQDRERVEEAWAGDILGIPNHGNLRVGDTLTEGEDLHFTGVPSFAPELLRRVRPDDPMKAKHLSKTLVQLGEEGAARVFRAEMTNEWIIGALGALQFEVLADRIRTEYNVPVHFESVTLFTARWVECDDPQMMKSFQDSIPDSIAFDHEEAPVFLARNAWHLDDVAKDWPDVRFIKTKEQTL
ncbi:peptide chain release factor 3 [Magnetococcales bacterium HHB-1]